MKRRWPSHVALVAALSVIASCARPMATSRAVTVADAADASVVDAAAEARGSTAYAVFDDDDLVAFRIEVDAGGVSDAGANTEDAEDAALARALFEAGAQLYASSNYADAVRLFGRAYLLAPRPSVLFSLAQAERRLSLQRADPEMVRQAVEHFQRYLAEVHSGGRRRDALEATLELEAHLTDASSIR